MYLPLDKQIKSTIRFDFPRCQLYILHNPDIDLRCILISVIKYPRFWEIIISFGRRFALTSDMCHGNWIPACCIDIYTRRSPGHAAFVIHLEFLLFRRNRYTCMDYMLISNVIHSFTLITDVYTDDEKLALLITAKRSTYYIWCSNGRIYFIKIISKIFKDSMESFFDFWPKEQGMASRLRGKSPLPSMCQ